VLPNDLVKHEINWFNFESKESGFYYQKTYTPLALNAGIYSFIDFSFRGLPVNPTSSSSPNPSLSTNGRISII